MKKTVKSLIFCLILLSAFKGEISLNSYDLSNEISYIQIENNSVFSKDDLPSEH